MLPPAILRSWAKGRESFGSAGEGVQRVKVLTLQHGSGSLVTKEVIRGDPKQRGNIFRWSHVRLNLPGSMANKPHLPWVSKVQAEDGRVANDFITYVDDTRSCRNSWLEARHTSRMVVSKLNWLGIQDAARKRRDPCQEPGPWAGSVVHVTPEGGITVSVTQ